MAENIQKKSRRLLSWEIQEFREVFGDTLDYDKVTIHEGASWPDRMDKLGRWLKRMPPADKNSHNAITLGNHCFFPVNLPESLIPSGDPESYKLDWLVHELTHAWQYQHEGWAYLWRAVIAQLQHKEKAYDYGGESGLIQSWGYKKRFRDFNPEQQGNITQAYFIRKRAAKSVAAWEPYIGELKSMRKSGLTKDRSK